MHYKRLLKKTLFAGIVCAMMLAGCAKDKMSVVENPTPLPTESMEETTGNEGQDEGDNKADKGDKDKKEEKNEGEPTFTVRSGFYNSSFTVELESNKSGAIIYYTLDGSTPDENSSVYTEGIVIDNRTSQKNVLSAVKGVNTDGDFIPDYKVDKGTVIRAIAKLEDGSFTKESTATYFVGIDSSKYDGVPVISIATDFDNLFDYEKGIYVMGKTYDDWIAEDPGRAYLGGWQKQGNFSNRGKEWERYSSFELIDTDRTSGFSQNVGIRIMGAASRTGQQKSFRIVAREEYGKKNVTYDLIPGNERTDGNGLVEKYRSFVVRIGGNDRDYARFRDPYLQELVAGRRFDTYQTRPAVVFLNGEYWGMYTIVEDYSKHYFENNYGIEDDNIVYVKRGKIEDGLEEDIAFYYEMFDFIYYNDMTDPDNYAKACEYIDMDSLADYVALNFYIYNQDDIFVENNNWAMWRVREKDDSNPYADGRFRMMVYDLDYSTGIYDGGNNYSENNLRAHLLNRAIANYENATMADVILNLLKNPEFKQKLVTVMCDMRNVEFEVSRAWALLGEYSDTYSKYMPDTIKRFGPFWAVNDAAGYYKSKVLELRGFMNGRYLKYPDLIKKAFELENAVSVNINFADGSLGTVKINTSTIDSSKNFSGSYFTEYPVTITAIPADGHKLVRWEYEGCEVLETGTDTITIKLTGNCKINPVFE